jgi:hypothetical protein
MARLGKVEYSYDYVGSSFISFFTGIHKTNQSKEAELHQQNGLFEFFGYELVKRVSSVRHVRRHRRGHCHRVRVHRLHRRQNHPFVPGSNRGRIPDDRLAVQKAPWFAGRSQSKLLPFLWWRGSYSHRHRLHRKCFRRQSHHHRLDRLSWPVCTACSALASNIHALERTFGRQQ